MCWLERRGLGKGVGGEKKGKQWGEKRKEEKEGREEKRKGGRIHIKRNERSDIA